MKADSEALYNEIHGKIPVRYGQNVLGSDPQPAAPVPQDLLGVGEGDVEKVFPLQFPEINGFPPGKGVGLPNDEKETVATGVDTLIAFQFPAGGTEAYTVIGGVQDLVTLIIGVTEKVDVDLGMEAHKVGKEAGRKDITFSHGHPDGHGHRIPGA